MGKKLFLFAAAAAVLVSCTENDLGGDTSFAKESTSDAIQFSAKTRSAGSTRAGVEGQIDTNDKLKGTAEIKTSTTVSGFGVFAYMKGTNGATDCYTYSTSWSWNTGTPNFMYNQKVDWNTTAGAWGYSPLKYWPNDFAAGNVDNSQPATEANKAQGSVAAGKLSFFAYAPYVSASDISSASTEGIIGLTANSATTEPKVTFRFKHSGTYGTNAVYDISTSNNVDLLWGTRTTASYDNADGGTNATTSKYQDTEGNYYNTDLTKQKTAETVDFKFKHALAKIGGYEDSKSGIQVVADFDDNDATPKESQAAGSKAAETLITLNSITIANAEETGTNKMAVGGVFNIATGLWESQDYDTGASFSKTYNASDAANNSAVWEPATPNLTYSSGWKQGGSALAGVDETFKDVFTSATDALYIIPGSNAKLKITVQYTVRTYDSNLADLDGEGTAETTSTKVVQTIANVVDFTALKSNHYYKLIIHLGLTSVKFAAEVAEWDQDNTSGDNTEVIWLPSNTTE